jgi:hypothetical protein
VENFQQRRLHRKSCTDEVIVRSVEPRVFTVNSSFFSSLCCGGSATALLFDGDGKDHGAFPSKLAIFQPIERLLFQVLQRR